MDDSIEAAKNFQSASKNYFASDAAQVPVDEWPEEWKKTYYKDYSRFDVLELPHPELTTTFNDLLSCRKSDREYVGNGIGAQTLSDLLQSVCGKGLGEEGEKHRSYASGGARYPVEVYIVMQNSSDSALQEGVYHYQVRVHSLEYLWPVPPELPSLFQDEWAEKADILFVMTAVFARSTNKYKNRGYRFAYIDAGAILQNLYLFSTQRTQLKVSAYSGTNDDNIEKLLDIDGQHESVLCCALIGT
jgi:SagB-type dehydrogenase family enzyme